MKEKEKISLLEIKEAAILSASIPPYKAMGFRNDSNLTNISAELSEIIEYSIGDKLKEVREKISKRTNAIRLSCIGDAKVEELSDEERKEFSIKINKAANSDEELTGLLKEEAGLWDIDLEKSDLRLTQIEIEEKEYSEKFTGDSKKITLSDEEFQVDGYTALLSLIAKGFVKIKNQE